MSAQTLATLPLAKNAVVQEIDCERQIRRRLLEMGIVPGTTVSVVRVAPLGDPIELRLRGYALSIRRTEAAGVKVEG